MNDGGESCLFFVGWVSICCSASEEALAEGLSFRADAGGFPILLEGL